MGMELEAYWQGYVGAQTPLEFLEHWHDCSLNDYVGAYVSQLPHLYGVVLHKKWKETFSRAEQPRRSDVTAGLLGYLEAHRDAWAGLPMGEVEIARFMGEDRPYPHQERSAASTPVPADTEAEHAGATGIAVSPDPDEPDAEGDAPVVTQADLACEPAPAANDMTEMEETSSGETVSPDPS